MASHQRRSAWRGLDGPDQERFRRAPLIGVATPSGGTLQPGDFLVRNILALDLVVRVIHSLISVHHKVCCIPTELSLPSDFSFSESSYLLVILFCEADFATLLSLFLFLYAAVTHYRV